MIRVGNDKGSPKLLKRSIRHLIPIEVTGDDTKEEIGVASTDHDDLVEAHSRSDSLEMTPEVITRPHCHAAIYGEALRRTWTRNS